MSETSPPPPPRRFGLGCLGIAVAGLVALALFGLALINMLGGAPQGSVDVVVESSPPEPRGTLAIVEARGVMVGGRSRRGSFTGDLMAQLRAIKADDSIQGVLLYLDTPGGLVTDADVLHHEVSQLRTSGRKVLVHMGDMCASGGVYLAMAGDEIWALPTTTTGSIGVIINSINISALMARYGVTDTSVSSGPHKQMLSPTRPPSDADRLLLQGIVDQMYDRFLRVVADGRRWDGEVGLARARALADGRLLTARDADEAGLIDAIGYREEALDRLRSLVGGGPFKVIRYRAQPGLLELLSGRAPTSGAAGLPLQMLAGPRVMYMLNPSASWSMF